MAQIKILPIKKISIVVPAYNEEGNINFLVDSINQVMDDLDYIYELIIVDDGSSDGTWAKIIEISSCFSFVKGLRLSRNFGHQHALLAGLFNSTGDAVVSMDADLQHPPNVINELIAKWEQGFAIVNTRRQDDKITGKFKRLTSKYFYKLFSVLADVNIREGSSDFRLMDRHALDAMLKFQDVDLFIRGAVQWLGFPTCTVTFKVAERHSGKSKYNIKRMIRFAQTALIAYSDKPLRIGIGLGVLTSTLAFTELFYIVYRVVIGKTVAGWASTVGIISLLFGILFIILGIIGTYLASIHKVLQGRPRFVIFESTSQESKD